MERYQAGSILKLKRKGGEAVWAFRFYEAVNGKRTYRKKLLGTLAELPLKKDAEKIAEPLRVKINSGIESPETVADLIAHYRDHELTPERKAFASISNFNGITARHLIPKWSAHKLSEVRTVQVEEWLDSLEFAPATKTKIKAIFSVLFSHAIRHEWLTFNPILKVRTSSKPLRKKDVLEPLEFQNLLAELSIRDRAAVLLAGSTGLRRSEFIGLTWAEIDVVEMQVFVTRSCFRGRFGKTKTDASNAPVPLHPIVLEALLDWRRKSFYGQHSDFVFPSIKLNGKKPLSPDMILKSTIKPALARAGITDKQIGWHSFRHSLATWLRSMGVDIKVAQELLRHANSRTTLDLYTQAISSQKRIANDNVVEMILKKKAG
jgi:integrase